VKGRTMGSSAAGVGHRDTEHVRRSVQAARCSGEVELELDAA
jgi:hypothetical protein